MNEVITMALKTPSSFFAVLCFAASTSMAFAAPQTVLPNNVPTCGLHLQASFVEGAPTDRFSIENQSQGRWSITSVTFMLDSAAGNLIFDTENGGGGVEVFQPFKEVTATPASSSSSAKLRRVSNLRDGGATMNMDFTHFEPGEGYSFTIDIDDQLQASAAKSELGQIRVSAGELEGATIRFVLASLTGEIVEASTQFNASNEAVLKGQTCTQG